MYMYIGIYICIYIYMHMYIYIYTYIYTTAAKRVRKYQKFIMIKLYDTGKKLEKLRRFVIYSNLIM